MDFVSGVGNINIDILYSGIDQIPNEGEEVYSQGFDVQLGGGIPATMINLARLGVPTKFSTFLGNDMFSNYAKEKLTEFGIPYKNLDQGDRVPVTITSIISTKRDRTFISYNEGFQYTKEQEDEIYSYLKGSKIVEMSVNFLDIYKRLKEDGTILVFDVGWEDDLSLEKYSEYLTIADYFTPNQKEALKITGTDNLEDAGKQLGECFDKVIIKLDKDGCMLVENGVTHVLPPLRNIEAVDSTGAGDAFLSGFMYGLYHNYSVKDAIIFGNITGGTCVQGYGCLSRYVDEKQLLAMAEELKRDL